MNATASRPLDGVRVLEFSGIGPAPFAAMLLSDLGASIVRVDRPEYTNPQPGYDATRDPVGRGRLSVGLDLKHEDARAVLRRLVCVADVVIDPYRPGVLERLEFGPDDVHALNPGVVYARMTGWGQTGPLADQPGHGINYLSMSGALNALGRRGEAPFAPLNLVDDYAGGSLFLVLGILAGLYERERTTAGRVVDAAILDGAASLMTLIAGYRGMGIWNDERGTNLIDSAAPFYETYACADGGFMAVGAVEPEFYERFVRGLGFEPDELPDQLDEDAWPAMKAKFADRFAQEPRDHWSAVFETAGACCTPVLSLDDAARHPHNAQRQLFVEAHGMSVPNAAPRFSVSAGAIDASLPPVAPGASTRVVLEDCGYSADEIQGLIDSKAAFEVSHG